MKIIVMKMIDSRDDDLYSTLDEQLDDEYMNESLDDAYDFIDSQYYDYIDNMNYTDGINYNDDKFDYNDDINYTDDINYIDNMNYNDDIYNYLGYTDNIDYFDYNLDTSFIDDTINPSINDDPFTLPHIDHSDFTFDSPLDVQVIPLTT